MLSFDKIILAFLSTLLLITIAGYLLKKLQKLLNSLGYFKSHPSSFKHIETFYIDPKRKCVVIEHLKQRHLLLLGPQNDILLQSYSSESEPIER